MGAVVNFAELILVNHRLECLCVNRLKSLVALLTLYSGPSLVNIDNGVFVVRSIECRAKHSCVLTDIKIGIDLFNYGHL